jgi:hypothetical protein
MVKLLDSEDGKDWLSRNMSQKLPMNAALMYQLNELAIPTTLSLLSDMFRKDSATFKGVHTKFRTL